MVRDGKTEGVFREDIVVGDIIVLKGGMQVPADGLVVKANQLIVG